MASLIATRFSLATLRRRLIFESQEAVFNRTATLEMQITPSKVSGDFVTFEDGSRFRCTTDYFRMRSWLEPGLAQNMRGIYIKPDTYTGNRSYIETSAGGLAPDRIWEPGCAFHCVGKLGFNSLITAPQITQSQRNEAVTKALNNLADQKANVGENLATFRQTLHLMRNPISGLIEGLRSVHKNKSFKPFLYMSAREIRKRGLLNTISEEYLKYVYGFKPLMQDIFGLVELAKEHGNTPLLLSAMGKSKQQDQTDLFEFSEPSINSMTTIGPLDIDARVLCNIWARIDPNYTGTRALNQLGLLNPASLAWDLVPWSFVVDWLVPIGPVLQALTAPAGLIFVNGSISTRVSATGPSEHWYTVMDNVDDYEMSTFQVGTSAYRYEGYARESILGWPRPGLWFDSDPLRGDRPFKALALSILSLRSLK